VKPTNGSFIFKLFSKGCQLKIKLATHFPKLETDPSFYYSGGVSNRGKGLHAISPSLPAVITTRFGLEVLHLLHTHRSLQALKKYMASTDKLTHAGIAAGVKNIRACNCSKNFERKYTQQSLLFLSNTYFGFDSHWMKLKKR